MAALPTEFYALSPTLGGYYQLNRLSIRQKLTAMLMIAIGALNRRAAMAVMHLRGPPAHRQRQQLVAEADAEQGLLAVEHLANDGDRIFPGRRRVALTDVARLSAVVLAASSCTPTT